MVEDVLKLVMVMATQPCDCTHIHKILKFKLVNTTISKRCTHCKEQPEPESSRDHQACEGQRGMKFITYGRRQTKDKNAICREQIEVGFFCRI